MNITQEQIEAAKSGQVVEIDADDAKLLLIRSDVLDQVQGGLPPEVVTQLVDRSMDEYDADDPLLDSYQKYRR